MTSGGKITLLQMNDTHAYLEPHPEIFWEGGQPVYRPAGGYARLMSLVQQARQERPGQVILLDNGDTLHGTYPAVQTQGRALIPLLNQLKADAMTAHWEFAYGPQTFQERAAELAYPVLALNVYRQASGERVFPSELVLERGGLRVGIVGLASNIVDKTMPPAFSQGLRFSLGKEELPAAIERLRREERVDLVVLLSHLGFPQDMQLAQDVPGMDVILSGHTHNRLYHPVRQGETLVIQSGSQGSFLGRLDLEVQQGRIVDFQHRLIETLDNVPNDPEMTAQVQAALRPFEAELAEVVGKTEVALERAYSLESSMDNFLLSALLEATGAQIAFSNGWRYGAPIPPGPITLNDLYNILPTQPPVSTVEMSGEEIWAMLEENLEHSFARNPYGQMGGYVKRALGLRVLFRVENPAGERIQKLYVGAQEVESERIYPVTFVTEQGVPAKYGQNRQKTALTGIEAMRRLLARRSPWRLEPQGTFTLV